jgi:hypothetical protein
MQIAAWLGHDVATLFRSYARVIAELDPTDRTPATERIEAARKSLRVIDRVTTGSNPRDPIYPKKPETAHLQAV